MLFFVLCIMIVIMLFAMLFLIDIYGYGIFLIFFTLILYLFINSILLFKTKFKHTILKFAIWLIITSIFIMLQLFLVSIYISIQ